MHSALRLLLGAAFLAHTTCVSPDRRYDRLLERLDKNNNGKLDAKELLSSADEWLDEDLHAQYVLMGDTSGDGAVTRQEFAEMMVWLAT